MKAKNKRVLSFSKYLECEEWELKKLQNGTKPNSSDEQQHIGNKKWKYNKITRKWDDLSPAEVKDKIEAIEELEESKKEKKYEFLDEHPKYEELKKGLKN